jgi:maltooligosyltrehalose trehalohydrolase
MPFGAEVLQEGGVRFSLWVPYVRQVDLFINDDIFPMDFLGDGWFQLVVYEAGPGTLYMYNIESELKVPDPASRYQPADVHGPSENEKKLAQGFLPPWYVGWFLNNLSLHHL